MPWGGSDAPGPPTGGGWGLGVGTQGLKDQTDEASMLKLGSKFNVF